MVWDRLLAALDEQRPAQQKPPGRQLIAHAVVDVG